MRRGTLGANMIGETIKGFRITGRLGEGGMGEVWVAQQPIVETRVAIKVLLAKLSTDQQFVQRFFNEARAVSMIKHAGIVKIHDVGFHNGSAFLIMELLEGESLASRLLRAGRLPLAQVADVGRQITSVLGATHAVGIIHRDLKPDNVFLVPDAELASGERVKVLDFGIAKLGTVSGATSAGATMGTPGYMAPEQWIDASKADAGSDVYALGCMVFEMCCGRLPFVAATFGEAYTKHAFEGPPRVRSLNPEVPPVLDDMIAAALAKRSEERPPMKALQQLFSDLGAVSPEAVGGSGFYAAASQNHQAWSTPHHVATGTPHPVATGTPHHVATGAPHHVATGAGRDQTALLAPVPQVAAPTVPLAPSPGRPGGRRALWVVLAALVLVGGGVGVALVATQSQRGPGPERPPVPPASDAKARLAAARSALAGLGDPAPPDTCPIEAAADAAELVLAAREAIATAPDRAIAAADNAIQKCPNAAAYNARGNALQKAGKLDAAGDAYNHALQLAPEYDAPRFNLGLLQIRAHDRSAIATFDEILRRKPDDADAHKARAQAYIDAKRFDDAATDLEKGLQGKGDDGAAWLLLGQLRDKTGRGDAREAYCKASTLGVQAAAALCKR